MRLGIFGGTFDPPHIGHLIVAQDAALALGLDRVLFVPAGTPPHKRHRIVSAPAVRLAMVHAAVAGNGRFAVDTSELEAAGRPSYTIETLRAFERSYPGAELWLLLGADQWEEFGTWREPDAILRRARVAVIQRPDREASPPGRAMEPVAAGGWDPGVRHLHTTRIGISSSEIRRRVGVGESIRYLVPDPVIELVFREQLYR